MSLSRKMINIHTHDSDFEGQMTVTGEMNTVNTGLINFQLELKIQNIFSYSFLNCKYILLM